MTDEQINDLHDLWLQIQDDFAAAIQKTKSKLRPGMPQRMKMMMTMTD